MPKWHQSYSFTPHPCKKSWTHQMFSSCLRCTGMFVFIFHRAKKRGDFEKVRFPSYSHFCCFGSWRPAMETWLSGKFAAVYRRAALHSNQQLSAQPRPLIMRATNCLANSRHYLGPARNEVTLCQCATAGWWRSLKYQTTLASNSSLTWAPASCEVKVS